MKYEALASLQGFDLAGLIGIGVVAFAIPVIAEIALKPVIGSDKFREVFGDSSKKKFAFSAIAAYLVLDAYGLDFLSLFATALGHPAPAGTIGTAVSAAFVAGGRNAVNTVLDSTGLKRFLSSNEQKKISHEG